MPEQIVCWRDIEWDFRNTPNGTAFFENTAILLGNGASISVYNRFAYPSLKELVMGQPLLSDDGKKIFKCIGTDNFETILRMVSDATRVNEILGIENEKTKNVYEEIRKSLASAVQNIHPPHDDVTAKIGLIYDFISQFKRIISLNYDLLIYWAIMHGNSNNADGCKIKDCFGTGGVFSTDWKELETPIRSEQKCPLVFYPHGNLALVRDMSGNETKTSSGGAGLLETILDAWEQPGSVPIFVSEGSSVQKQKSIRSSDYLSTVYNGVLATLPAQLVIYGWNLGEADQHILKGVSKSPIQHVAVSVYRNSDQDEQNYCSRVLGKLSEVLRTECKVTFFDSESTGCWINE